MRVKDARYSKSICRYVSEATPLSVKDGERSACISITLLYRNARRPLWPGCVAVACLCRCGLAVPLWPVCATVAQTGHSGTDRPQRHSQATAAQPGHSGTDRPQRHSQATAGGGRCGTGE